MIEILDMRELVYDVVVKKFDSRNYQNRKRKYLIVAFPDAKSWERLEVFLLANKVAKEDLREFMALIRLAGDSSIISFNGNLNLSRGPNDLIHLYRLVVKRGDPWVKVEDIKKQLDLVMDKQK